MGGALIAYGGVETGSYAARGPPVIIGGGANFWGWARGGGPGSCGASSRSRCGGGCSSCRWSWRCTTTSGGVSRKTAGAEAPTSRWWWSSEWWSSLSS